MKKILFGLLLLTSVLMVSLEQPAFAAGTFANFTKMHDYYDQFEDVGGQWFAPYVTRGYDWTYKVLQLTLFGRTSVVTLAETITLASRIHSIFYRALILKRLLLQADNGMTPMWIMRLITVS